MKAIVSSIGAYDRKSPFGRLDKALDAATFNKWTVVDMKNDWKRIFPFENQRTSSGDEGPTRVHNAA